MVFIITINNYEIVSKNTIIIHVTYKIIFYI